MLARETSTLALSEIIAHNSCYPRRIRIITLGQNASQQSSSNFDIVLYGGNNSHLILRQVPHASHIFEHYLWWEQLTPYLASSSTLRFHRMSSNITFGGKSSRLILRPGILQSWVMLKVFFTHTHS